jgi:hypothetical protein
MSDLPEDTITTLFEKDPTLLTETDVQRIVDRLREDRAQWEKKESKGRKVDAPKDLTLDDLKL